MKLFDTLSGVINKKTTRRSFLKASAAGVGGLALMGLTSCQTAPGQGRRAARRAPTTTFHNVCPRNCFDRCSIITEVQDGKITRIKGDRTHPITEGSLCAKMNHYRSYTYHPDRILYPMKRVGRKGEGRFERISWDEALDTIAQKTHEIVNTHGAEAILPYNYSGVLGYVNNFGTPIRFFNKLGASGLARDVCASAGFAAVPLTYGADRSMDPEYFANTKLMVSWGASEVATNVHVVKFLNKMQENGGKLVVINPVRTPIANKADLFLQIKPGTDAALALCVMNIIIENGWQDQEFINNYTIGYAQLVEQARNYPIERVSQITGLSVASIREFANMYGTTKPSILRMGYGIQRHSNGGSIIRALTLLPALMGLIGISHDAGYYYYNGLYTWDVDWNALMRPDLLAGRTPRIINMSELSKALTGGLDTTAQNPIKGLIVFNSNPMAMGQNTELIRRGLRREDLFTVVADIFQTDTVNYADIVIPASSFFEFEDLAQCYCFTYISLNEEAIRPLGESKSNHDFFTALAKRCGFTDDCFNDTPEQIIRDTLSNDSQVLGPVTYERLKNEKWIKLHLQVAFADKDFPTPSGKIEFYSERLKDMGMHPVAEYVELAESRNVTPDLFARYPLNLLTPASKNLSNSQMHNIEQVKDLIGDPIVYIHPVDATARGINDGDLVELFNDRARTRLVAKVCDKAVIPGAPAAFKCKWPKFTGGTSVNSLTSDRLADMGGGSAYNTNLVQIRRV